ncbi:FHA domain-containing protein [Leisingera aquaemixtae]|nr:FHA domain-containing protein [Leisingera aquaemixtae]
MGRGASRAGRVKTRLLGFSPAQAPGSDPFSRSAEGAAPGYTQFPVGWLAVVQGPGRGAAFTLFSGVSVIGRGEDQTVRLDFGDNSISRDNHAAIAYDPEQKSFYIGHGGKANLVRRNGRPVLSTEELAAGDVIRIGETTLRFVPLCGADFGWDQPQQRDGSHAAFS